MYKKVCTPIVQYYKRKYDEISVFNITVVNHKNHTLNLYHGEYPNELVFSNFNEAIACIEKILSNNGFRAKTIGHDGGINWLNIQWINMDNQSVEIYGKK